MLTKSENEQKIDEYIAQNPDCKLPKTHSVVLKGTNHDLQVYKLPLDLLFYNIKNGRFASEYIELKEKIGRDLEFGNTEDKKTIQKMLLKLDEKKSLELELDIRKLGQRQPGICTRDGSVHDGNRRMSVIQNIVDGGDMKFNFVQVARLPLEIDSQDLWLIEAGIQLSKNVQLEYGPVNELLKFKEGIDSGLTPMQVATNLYGFKKESEVIDKLEVLKLVTRYLKYIGEPGRFKKVDRMVEHFIDLHRVLKTLEKNGSSKLELDRVRDYAFQASFDGISQFDLRKLKKLMTVEKSKDKILEASQKYCKPGNSEEKQKIRAKARDEEGFTPALTIFHECDDIVKAVSDESKPLTLITRAFTNVEQIDDRNEAINKEDFQKLLGKIDDLIKKLKK